MRQGLSLTYSLNKYCHCPLEVRRKPLGGLAFLWGESIKTNGSSKIYGILGSGKCYGKTWKEGRGQESREEQLAILS